MEEQARKKKKRKRKIVERKNFQSKPPIKSRKETEGYYTSL